MHPAKRSCPRNLPALTSALSLLVAYNSAQGRGNAPQFLRTHPLDSTRIERLAAFMPRAEAEYRGM